VWVTDRVTGKTLVRSVNVGDLPPGEQPRALAIRAVELLRASPGENGLVTTVSGMLTKQACALWSTTPNPDGWVCNDVTAQVREAMDIRELIAEYQGEGVVAGYTVLYQGDEAWRAVAVFDLPDGRRTVAYSEQPEILAAMQQRENCGERFMLADGRFVTA
jgi:acetyl-CoA C-acetyltransferase